MSDIRDPASGDRQPRRAMADIPASVREEWRDRYLALEGDEFAIQALVERAEAEMRANGEETTIRTLWIRLADEAGRKNAPDVRAAAALAGLALGLRPG